MIDLGRTRSVLPTHYSLRHGANWKADSLRTWDLQGMLCVFVCIGWSIAFFVIVGAAYSLYTMVPNGRRTVCANGICKVKRNACEVIFQCVALFFLFVCLVFCLFVCFVFFFDFLFHLFVSFCGCSVAYLLFAQRPPTARTGPC